VVGKRIDSLNMIYEEDIPILENTMKRLSGGKELKVISSNRNYTKNREIRECVWYNSVLLNENGQMSSVMSLVDDVTEIRKVEKLLKESEDKLWSVLNATQESIYMFDKEGRFTMANSTGLNRLNNITEQELIGRHFSEFMPPAQARQRQAKLDKVFKTGEPLEFEDVRNGVMFHHNFFPLFNENEVSHVVTYSTDITSRKLAEKDLQSTKDYLENLINYANAPIIVWNPDREIRLFNHAFERLTGYTSTEVDGKKIDLLFPDASLRESNSKIRAALIENWTTIEIPIQTKKGKIRTVLWNSANIYDADKKTVLSTIAQGNDITERIQAEQKVKERTKDLELANVQLQQELKERYLAQEALRNSEAQLKELNATKDKFFNIVAHDLKNPFTSLLGSSELLFRNIGQMDLEKIKTLALILNDSAKNGYAILQNLLDWSRSQTGLLKFNPERINLKKLIGENISNLQLPAANKDIDLRSEAKDDNYVFADKNMINTILRNLLSNSIKFTNRGGKVIVRSTINSFEVIISVKDTGIGISKENIEKLFRIDVKYSRPGTDNEQGTGLGLKLSKEFVEKQGGRIWVESVENGGSDFKFTIPLKNDQTPDNINTANQLDHEEPNDKQVRQGK
jgi:PAS domain S-box-containing protein